MTLNIMFVVHALRVLLCVVAGPLGVDPVQAFGLNEFVSLGCGKAHEGLLGEGMRNGLALLALVVFKQLKSLKRGSTRDEFVREFAFAHLWLVVAVVLMVYFLVRVVGLAPAEDHCEYWGVDKDV
jgi:hypothetical protein